MNDLIYIVNIMMEHFFHFLQTYEVSKMKLNLFFFQEMFLKEELRRRLLSCITLKNKRKINSKLNLIQSNVSVTWCKGS